MKRFAVLSMDVEDWYHTGYLNPEDCDQSVTRLKAMDDFADLLKGEQIHGQFFVLGDLLKKFPERFRALLKDHHEVGSHGRAHVPPTSVSLHDFQAEVEWCAKTHLELLGRRARGFRACRFMLDRERLDVLRTNGFTYDSSVIFRRSHLDFNLEGFHALSEHILTTPDGFFEFRLPSYSPSGRWHWPIAGGGAFRILPYALTSFALRRRMVQGLELYSFYIHPIDLSQEAPPPLPKGLSPLQRLRMQWGRESALEKLRRLIHFLRQEGFQFTTYADLQDHYTTSKSIASK